MPYNTASASRLFSTGASANNAASADGSIVTTVAGRTLPQAVDTVTSLPRIKVHAASASAGLAPGVDMLVIPLVKVDKVGSSLIIYTWPCTCISPLIYAHMRNYVL